MVLDTNCPKCKSFDIIAVPSLEVKCRNCKIEFDSDLGINIYYSVAKKINMELGKNNGVTIIGVRDNTNVFHPDDALKPRTKLEDDIWHAILEIERNFKSQLCWNVSDITADTDLDYQIQCKECGYCKNCVTCNKCNHRFVPNITKNGERRFTCPKCKAKSYKDTIIDKVKIDGKVLKCPHCESPKIRMARFTSDKKKCPKCSSEKITEPRKIPVYKLIIERQKRFWIDG